MTPLLKNVDNLRSVKTRIMEHTRSNMSFLAHYLGYGWCGGNDGIGKGFIRDGDSWIVDTNGYEFKGYKADQRLSLVYGDWRFFIKNIKYGDSIVTETDPETVDSGMFINNDNTEATKTISHIETVKRTVTHVKTGSWKAGQDLGLIISYPGVSASYKFNYENSETTTDTTGKEHSLTIDVSTSKTLAPYSAASWKIVVLKTQKTTPYTATIIVRFSTEFQGFLRYGQGYNGNDPNYHYDHRGSKKRPTFNYRFGNAQTPFYADLKQQSSTTYKLRMWKATYNDSNPWMWTDMKAKYSDAQNIIDRLCNEKNYVFELKGEFQDVEGKAIFLRWDKAPPIDRHPVMKTNKIFEALSNF